jgi:glycosyltransferase involved in cell wall biosynthesis
MQKSIMFHCREYPPQPGGVGSYMQNMAKSLTLLGHRVVVLTSQVAGCPDVEEGTDGIIYRAYHVGEARSERVAHLALRLARKHEVDWIEGADHHGEMASLLRATSRPPVLVKIHGSNPVRILQRSHVMYPWQRLTVGLAAARNWKQTRAERFSIEHADMAAIPSERMHSELKRQGFRLPARIAILPNPAPMAPDPACEEAPVPTVLMIGRIDVGKGIQYIPAIVAYLVARHPDVRIEIAGDDSYARGIGSLRSWLTNQLGELSGHVIFLGKLEAQALHEAYGRAWVVMVPSRWDNFPTVVLEAMARGKAIVSSPNGGMPEMLDETLCRIEDPALPVFSESILHFLADRSLRMAAGSSARQRATSVYDAARIARRYVEFMQYTEKCG